MSAPTTKAGASAGHSSSSSAAAAASNLPQSSCRVDSRSLQPSAAAFISMRRSASGTRSVHTTRPVVVNAAAARPPTPDPAPISTTIGTHGAGARHWTRRSPNTEDDAQTKAHKSHCLEMAVWVSGRPTRKIVIGRQRPSASVTHSSDGTSSASVAGTSDADIRGANTAAHPVEFIAKCARARVAVIRWRRHYFSSGGAALTRRGSPCPRTPQGPPPA